MSSLFNTFLYVPIYNLLIFFVDVVPYGDVGIAVIIVTVIIKVLLWPFSIMAIKTQRRMKFVEPQLKKIREKYKDNKEKQALETLALYKNNGIRPFSSLLVTLLQLPVIFALYFVFHNEHLLAPNQDLIYSFIAFPSQISPLFLGIFPTTGHVLVLALVAGLAQFLQAYITIPVPPKSTDAKPGGAEEFARALAIQSRLILPILIGALAYTSGALAIYFITSSIVSLFQEYYVRFKLRHLTLPQAPAEA
jgi:YidC/Oxa1 family membrane protein insertase